MVWAIGLNLSDDVPQVDQLRQRVQIYHFLEDNTHFIGHFEVSFCEFADIRVQEVMNLQRNIRMSLKI